MVEFGEWTGMGLGKSTDQMAPAVAPIADS